MQCANFEPRLQELLDADPMLPASRLLSDPLLSDHAAQCPACRQLLASMAAVVRAAATLEAPAACRPTLTDRVLEEMRPRPPVRVLPMHTMPLRSMPLRTMHWRWAAPLAAAAMLALALPIWSWLAGPGGSRVDQLAQTNAPPPIAAAPSMAAADNAGNSNLNLELNLDTNFDLGLTGFSDDVREGFAPVTRSTAGTLESLWQAISPSEDSRT